MHKYDIDECTSLFYIVVDKVLGINKMKFILMQEMQLEPELEKQLHSVVEQLLDGKPIQYILSEAYFYGLKFFVSSSVLIPRPETEELVDWIRKDLNSASSSGKKVLDIGTGSGCIPIALKKNAPELECYGLDISPAAITIAEQNASLNNVDVCFIQADIFNYQTLDTFDIIVSNPPYIKEDEKAQMEENVLAYEPHAALFVSNEKPLIFYEEIAAFSKKHLAAGGVLFFEINANLSFEMNKMLLDEGFRNVTIKKDMQGKDRMIRCQRE
jgi:release factor glutamine methyltransferase